jgi:hypothetical protein
MCFSSITRMMYPKPHTLELSFFSLLREHLAVSSSKASKKEQKRKNISLTFLFVRVFFTLILNLHAGHHDAL